MLSSVSILGMRGTPLILGNFKIFLGQRRLEKYVVEEVVGIIFAHENVRRRCHNRSPARRRLEFFFTECDTAVGDATHSTF